MARDQGEGESTAGVRELVDALADRLADDYNLDASRVRAILERTARSAGVDTLGALQHEPDDLAEQFLEHG